MKISVLQPNIIRGSVEHNTDVVNHLLEDSEGELAVLAEYALTGSLVLDKGADPWKWAGRCETALKSIVIPSGKKLLINHLVQDHGKLYNESTFLPEGGFQRKCFPDPTESKAGIQPGKEFPLFSFGDRKFKVIICTDLRNIEHLSTEGADFVFFIFHFTLNNLRSVTEQARKLSLSRKLPVITASLCSDQNCGHSTYIDGNTMVSLGNTQGILEIGL